MYNQPAQIQLHDLSFKPLINQEAIQARVAELGAELTRLYEGRVPIFISILSGSFVFTSDLLRAFDGTCEIRFVKLSSYTGTQSTGEVKTVMGVDIPLKGRDVVVVEDIIDSGRTFHYFLQQLAAAEPASIRTVTFLVKPSALKYEVQMDLKGFEIENEFVVGYGLDYDELGRNLPALYVLDPEASTD